MQKRKIPDPNGNLIDGTEVDVIESIERFSDVKLEDGTVLRIRVAVQEVVRFDGLWDNINNPMYHVSSATMVFVKEAPDNLKKSPNKEDRL